MRKSTRARTAAAVERAQSPDARGGKYAGLDASERRRQRRERLLAAGHELFGSAGFASTTIEQICATANVASRTFYEEFGSRDALLAALYLDCVAKLSADVYRAIGLAGNDPEKVVRAGLGAYVGNMARDAKAGRIMLLESIGVSAELELLRRGVMREFATRTASIAASFAASGAIEAADFGGLTLALVGATNEIAIESVLSAGQFPPKRAVELLSHLWIRAFASVPVAQASQPPPAPLKKRKRSPRAS